MRRTLIVLSVMISLTALCPRVYADDGCRLWLKYDLVGNSQKLWEYRESVKGWAVEGSSPTMEAAKRELRIALDGLLGSKIPEVSSVEEDGELIAGT